jgi:hypothetical protein
MGPPRTRSDEDGKPIGENEPAQPVAGVAPAGDLAALHDRIRQASRPEGEALPRPDIGGLPKAAPWMVVWVGVTLAAIAIVIAALEIQ